MATSVPSSDEAYTVRSSDEIFTINSSVRPLTISSASDRQMAVPVIDLAISDSPLPSPAHSNSYQHTVEYINSTPEPAVDFVHSSSSEDIELLEAQAAAAEARLRLQKAKSKKNKRSNASSSGSVSLTTPDRPPAQDRRE